LSNFVSQERKGDYLGKTVQIVPHITNAIIDWVRQIATIPTDSEYNQPEVCLIELGGTVGDIESSVFLEAMRQLQARVGHDNMAIVKLRYENPSNMTLFSVWSVLFLFSVLKVKPRLNQLNMVSRYNTLCSLALTF